MLVRFDGSSVTRQYNIISDIPHYNGDGSCSSDMSNISMKECSAWLAGTYASIFIYCSKCMSIQVKEIQKMNCVSG